MKVTIIDYGAGNVPSVERALQRLGAESERTNSPDKISKAEALLLPGVGHYAALVRALDELLARRDDWPRVRAQARRFVEVERTWAVSIARYREVYAGALAASGRTIPALT